MRTPNTPCRRRFKRKLCRQGPFCGAVARKKYRMNAGYERERGQRRARHAAHASPVRRKVERVHADAHGRRACGYLASCGATITSTDEIKLQTPCVRMGAQALRVVA